MPKESKQISFTLELPKHLVVSLNAIYAGSHWRKRQQIKQGYLALTKGLFTGLKERYGAFDEPCEIAFDFSGTRIFDCDNHVYMGKMIQDCLVAAGIITDDTAKHLAKVSYAKSPKMKGQKGVVVSVEISSWRK